MKEVFLKNTSFFSKNSKVFSEKVKVFFLKESCHKSLPD